MVSGVWRLRAKLFLEVKNTIHLFTNKGNDSNMAGIFTRMVWVIKRQIQTVLPEVSGDGSVKIKINRVVSGCIDCCVLFIKIK